MCQQLNKLFHSLAWLISTNIQDADMQNEKYILSFLRLCICSPYLPVALGQVHWKLWTLRGWRSRTSARSWRRSRRRCSWPTFHRPGNILLLRRIYWSHSQSKHVIEGRFFFHNLFSKRMCPSVWCPPTTWCSTTCTTLPRAALCSLAGEKDTCNTCDTWLLTIA